MASVRCVDNALGFTQASEGMTNVGATATDLPVRGNAVRNLIEGADLVMSHITHFYHLTALDYINTSAGTAVSGQAYWSNGKDQTADMVGSLAGTSGLAGALVLEYVTALDIRRETHRMAAYASGKQPCSPALIPGGVTKTVDANMAASMSGLLTGIRAFIDTTYLPTIQTVAKAFSGDLLVGTDARGLGSGCKKYLAYGTFPSSSNTQFITGGFLDTTTLPLSSWTVSPLDPSAIREHVKYSFYDNGVLDIYDQLHPSVGVTKPSYGKAGAYSWLKAPRYQTGTGSANTNVCEVGPLARVLVNCLATGADPVWFATTKYVLSSIGLTTANIPNLRGVLGRHAARCIEAKVIADAMTGWISNVGTNTAGVTGETYRHRNIPTTSATGYGLTEAPRGALGHWIRIDGTKVSNYQAVVPTTWNAGPKDSYGQNGPIEQALNGLTGLTDDATGRTRVGRIIRSFDPCIACAVHIVSPDKKKVAKFEVVPPGSLCR